MAEPREITVPEQLKGERLDKAVARLFEVSRARAKELVESGVVTVDGRRLGASDRVDPGSTIMAPISQIVDRLLAERVYFGVLYEDDLVIVVDKPAGVVVHPGSGRSRGTLAAGLLHRYPELEGVGQSGRWGLVHRLDRDTSGAMLVARTNEVYEELAGQLRRRQIQRTYTALVEGKMGAETGTIEAPIGMDPNRPTRRAVTHDGKYARTHFEVIRYFNEVDVSLLQVRLETGRTHQIRVHMAAIDHPVVGDLTYGATRKDVGTPRIFLHAARLSFTHPSSGDRISVESPLPDDLRLVLDRLI